MRVLVGCEASGRVRDAFRALGHDAFSCDLVPCDTGAQWHIQADVLTVLGEGWDLGVFHPPCTYLAVSGLHWNKRRPERSALTEAALAFVVSLMEAPFPYAIENPIGCISTRVRRPDQIIQPWQFGEDASKATCLWLSGLPILLPTTPGNGNRKTRRANQTASGQNKLGPSPDRAKLRSLTYQGIATEMARQWGGQVA